MKKFIICLIALTMNCYAFGQIEGESDLPQAIEEGRGDDGENDPPPAATECCPGDNLIENGDFTNGMPSITSDYTSKPVNSNILLAGEYSVRRPTQVSNRILMACVEWLVHDQDHCGDWDAGAYLVVNGLTCNNGWQTALSISNVLEAGTYNFCVDLKNLRNSCINFQQPQIAIDVVQGGSTLATTLFSLNEPTSDPCAWKNTFLNFNVSTLGTVDIRIRHNADFRIDGNDFAVDNLSLKKLNQISQSDLIFDEDTENMGSNYHVTVTPVNPEIVGEGCQSTWTLVERTPPSTTWLPIPTATFYGVGPHNFNNYLFDYNKEYQITWTVSCPCALENSWTWGLPAAEFKTDFVIKSMTDPSIIYTNYEQLKGTEYDELYNFHISREREKETSQNENLKVYPNPTNGQFTLEANNLPPGSYSIEIYTMDGKLVRTFESINVENSTLKKEIKISNPTAGPLKIILKGEGHILNTTIVLE